MRIDHDCPHIGMAQQLLNRSDVVAVFQQVGGERMSERIATALASRPLELELYGLDLGCEGDITLQDPRFSCEEETYHHLVIVRLQ
jgi:hypothetical protein